MIVFLRLELLFANLAELVLVDREWLKETFATEVVFKDVKELCSFDLPGWTACFSEYVAYRVFVWSHSRYVSWNSMPYNLTEVALPLTTRTRFSVSQTVRMECTRAVIAAD